MMPKPGTSADGKSGAKAGMLMAGGKSSATGTKGGPPKATPMKHGSGLIKSCKKGC